MAVRSTGSRTLRVVTGWRGFLRFAVLVLAIGQVVSGLLIFWAVGLLVSAVAADRAVRHRRRTLAAVGRHPAGATRPVRPLAAAAA